MENNNITEEYISKMNKNRGARNNLYKQIGTFHKELSKRNESIKSIVQYTLIYLMFMGINIAISALEINPVAPIIYTALTVGYGVIASKDVLTICKIKPEEIYKKISECNSELSKLDNQYIEYTHEYAATNSKSNNQLYFEGIEKKIDDNSKDEELFFSESFIDEIEDTKVYVKK